MALLQALKEQVYLRVSVLHHQLRRWHLILFTTQRRLIPLALVVVVLCEEPAVGFLLADFVVRSVCRRRALILASGSFRCGHPVSLVSRVECSPRVVPIPDLLPSFSKLGVLAQLLFIAGAFVIVRRALIEFISFEASHSRRGLYLAVAVAFLRKVMLFGQAGV